MIEKVTGGSSAFQSISTRQSSETKEIDKIHRVQDKQQESPPQEPVTKEKVEEVVNGVNDFLEASNTSVQFQFHEKLKEYYVTIVDNNSKEVVREIPAKKMLDMYAAMTEYIGLMVDKKI
ncbi:flagellar protein FlaG [Rossellomorea vietnamensis]|uniref:Flagellar protein FlaG n=1 Tax=Rossellomorea vietnamensis TaxID=218284 RepID=A0A5D4NMM4_9BACI|nr:flagellar protein FlaG [Rossellomorea vietnamensis]TYS15179.1 flagellar protein FlaG [Rossellomorea vietnamensis]